MQKDKWVSNSKKSKINDVMPPKMPDIHDIRIQSEGKKLSKNNQRVFKELKGILIGLTVLIGTSLILGTPVLGIVAGIIVYLSIYVGVEFFL